MSHTSKIPPAKYATSDLPTDLEVGSLVFDSDTSEHKVFNGSSWDVVSGESFGTATIVSSNASTYDQIQGDIPANWKNADSSLKGLVIGTSCTNIGSLAFQGCSGLTGDLVIPNSVTSIGVGLLDSCSSLTSIVISESVTSIGSYAFYYCSSAVIYTNCPASSWVGTGACAGITDIYLGPNAVGTGYTDNWQAGFGSGPTVSTWTNYPDIP